jgi:hypothetical protein
VKLSLMTLLYQLPMMEDDVIRVWSVGGVLNCRKNQGFIGKICPRATLYKKSHTDCPGIELGPP